MRHTESAARVTAATDDRTDLCTGSSIMRQTPTHRTAVPVAGSVLVYETRRLGRELIGFEAVDDWNDLRTALAARGHGVGLTTMNHLAGKLLERARPLQPPGDDGGGEP